MWAELYNDVAEGFTHWPGFITVRIKEGIMTNLGGYTNRTLLVCKDAGVDQTRKCFLRCSLIKVSVDTGVVQNYPEKTRSLRA